MYRPSPMGGGGGGGENSGGNGSNQPNNGNINWPTNRPTLSSMTNANESNLREIRDSLVPFKASSAASTSSGINGASGGGAFLTKSTASSQSTLASSSSGNYIETALISSTNSSSSGYWSSSANLGGVNCNQQQPQQQQQFSMIPSNGFSLGGFDTSLASTSAFNGLGGLSAGHFMKPIIDQSQMLAKFRSMNGAIGGATGGGGGGGAGGVATNGGGGAAMACGGHPNFSRPNGREEAFSQIYQQLQPYSKTSTMGETTFSSMMDGGAGNTDTLSSESSSGTNGSTDLVAREFDLLEQLVGMGFERDSAWYALKLTQFRSLHHAVDVLLKLNMSHVFQDTRLTVSRKPSFDNGENGVGRSESPMPRIPTPQGRHQQYQAATGTGSAAASARTTPSAVSTTGAVYSIPVSNQRTPSPMSKPMSNVVGLSNYVNMVSPPSSSSNFGQSANATGSNQNAQSAQVGYLNGGDYFTAVASTTTSTNMTSGGPKRSHITVNLQSPPKNGTRTNGTSSSVADSLLVRERAVPIMQADKRQVEKPIAQSAVSPTIIAVNNNSPSSLLASKLDATTSKSQQQQQHQQQSTKVLSAHFDPKSLQAVRINVQPASDPNNGGQYVMKYQLEANTTSGHVVSIQGRGECNTAAALASSAAPASTMAGPTSSSPASTTTQMKLSSQRILLSPPFENGILSAEALSNHENLVKAMSPRDYSLVMAQIQQQQQQPMPGYHHHIVVGGGNGSGDNTMNADDSIDQAFAQRLKVTTTGGHHQTTTGIPLQRVGENQNKTATDSVATSSSTGAATASSSLPPSFLPSSTASATSRLGITRTIEGFPPLKEESISQQQFFPSRNDRASPTSSISTEESENSGCGGGNSTATVVNSANTPSTNEPPLVRCESPLPDCVLKKFNRSAAMDDGGQASTSNSGNVGGGASGNGVGVGANGGGGIGSNSVIKPCTPQAFKFFMEQHIENVIKQQEQRKARWLQLEKEMVKAKLSNQVQCQMRKLLNNKESNYLRLKRQKMNASMFERKKTIGLGAFGEVALVQKKDTATLYAMKILKKSDVIQKNQAAHVKAERDILSEADNEWVVKLFYSFQDKEHLFFIMEYIPGGDMMALLIKKGIFEEDLARFYIAELVCAIQSVHKLGFIHRDIKPDNILIDRDGHIKLTDFGLCTGLRWTHDWKYYAEMPKIAGHVYQDSFDKFQQSDPSSTHKVLSYRNKKTREQSHSLVGTPNYIAPEVLLRQGHTVLCDWWSVGVILYEMVLGHPPFSDHTPELTQKKVVNWKTTLEIPDQANLSKYTTDLIRKLCCGAENRLGREDNAADITRHKFFEKIRWSTLRSSAAPYKPEILHAMDTSNFDPVEPRPDLPSAFGTEKMSKHDHAFYEFTFRRFFDSDGHGCPTLRSRQQYHHPSLDTVLERANISMGGGASGSGIGSEESEETSKRQSSPSTANTNVRTAMMVTGGAYSRTPVYVNENGTNILRISTAEEEAAAAAAARDGRNYYYDDGDADEESMAAVYSGPGRPSSRHRQSYRPRAEDSFSFDDHMHAQASSDLDGETSDSAVYV